MKRITLLALLALALPLAAFANSIDTTNSGGTLAGSTAGMTLSGSQLIAINGFHGGGLITGNLGSVTLSTGTLSGGSLQMGGTFNGGGSFVISSTGAPHLPSGTLFNTFQWLLHRTSHVDAGDARQWNAQLHSEWCRERHLV
jgi:hypothetical protein